MAQTSYAEQAQGFAGMMGDMSEGHSAQTMLNGEASSEIGFGKFVVQYAGQVAGPASAGGGTPALAKLPASAGDDFGGGGVVLQAHDYDKRLDLGTTGVLPKRQLGVLRKGKVWVHCEEAMALTSKVFVRYTTNGALVPGDIRTDADTSKALQIKACRVIQATAGAGLCLIEIDMLMHAAITNV